MKLMFEGELPEHCYDCPIHDPGDGHCQIDGRTSDYRPFWCPLTVATLTADSDDAPHEMLAREFADEFRRMCDAYSNCMEDGDDCPLFTANICSLDELVNIVPIVENWAKEHPERKRKTYAEDFFEKFPKAELKYYDGRGNEQRIPIPCRQHCYGVVGRKCNGIGCSCSACWNEEMEDDHVL